MKKFFCALLLVAWAIQAYAPSVTLAWDPSQTSATDPTPNAEVATNGWYRVYYGVASHIYTNNVEVLGSITNATVSNLVVGVTYYFAATAGINGDGESEWSNEVSYTVPTPSTNHINPPTDEHVIPLEDPLPENP